MSLKKQKEVIQSVFDDVDALQRKLTEIKNDPTKFFISDEFGELVTKSYKVHVKTDEMIKNIVHTKRMNGITNYTQTKALRDAITLLYQTMEVRERPQVVRKDEGQRSLKISLVKTYKKKQQWK